MTSHPYIIAEIGSVHDGSFGNACRLIEVAANCGAGAVKFQTHIAEAETLANAPAPSYFTGEPRMEYFRRTGFTLAQWKKLALVASECKIDFLSSPFSLEAVDMLEEVGIRAYKIPSGEVTNLPLLEMVSRTGKPIYLSSGMSNWTELDEAVETLAGAGPLTLMQCTSAYPCPPESVGLNVMVEMAQRYHLAVGFSDHTMGTAGAVAAVVLGAVVLEKHLAFSRLMYGSDARHSLEPTEFKRYCDDVQEAAKIISSPVNKDDLQPFTDMKRVFEKSVVTATALVAGTVIGMEHLAFKKPGDGISASRFRELLGRRLVRSLPADHKFSIEDLQ